MMVTGTRLASGAVLSNTTFFTIEPDKTTTVDLVMRESKDQVQVIGNFNSEATYRPVGGTDLQSILQTCGRGYFVVAVLGVGQEPTNHALRDIAALRSEFEQWGRKMVFPLRKSNIKSSTRMNLKIFPLPLFMALMWITAFKNRLLMR